MADHAAKGGKIYAAELSPEQVLKPAYGDEWERAVREAQWWQNQGREAFPYEGMDKVEKWPKELLKKKETDPTCGCKTTRCRTFCGTLHGDDWEEFGKEQKSEGQEATAPEAK